VGALIVIVRRNAVAELVSGGIVLEAAVSPEILEAIFQKTSPVHDGAVIVRGDRIVRAAAVLPLTERERMPSYYGTRHRAAMGLSERCDALVVVVSEERGEVTLMEGRRMLRFDEEQKLAETLETVRAAGGGRTQQIAAMVHRQRAGEAGRGRPGRRHLEYVVCVDGNYGPYDHRAGTVRERAGRHGHRGSCDRKAKRPGAGQRMDDGLGQPDAAGGELQPARGARRDVESAGRFGGRQPAAWDRNGGRFAGADYSAAGAA
jgi:hypothetical protein